MTFQDCECIVTMHHICFKHVDQTRKQVSNAPCPAYKLVKHTAPESGCMTDGDRQKCIRRYGTQYEFKSEVDGMSPNDLWEKVWAAHKDEGLNERQTANQSVDEQGINKQRTAEQDFGDQKMAEQETKVSIMVEQETVDQTMAQPESRDQNMLMKEATE